MKNGAWLSAFMLGGAIAVACSDDDSAPETTMAGGEAGVLDSPARSGSPSAGGQSGSAGAPASRAGDGGDSSADGGAGPLDGGAAGVAAAAGTGASGEASAGSVVPTGPYITCPALGEKFELAPDDALNPDFSRNEENVALGKAFGCPLDDTTGRTLTVQRFQLDSQQLEVLSTIYLFDNYDWFTVRPDCGVPGYLEPLKVSYNADSEVTIFPHVFAEVLSPGIYTRVSCEVDMTEEQVPIPPQPLNIDCAHAVPLPSGQNNAYAEERILDEPALFYSFTLTEPDPGYVWDVRVNGYAVESSAGPIVKLHGDSFERESQMGALNAGHPAIFSPPPGSYCVEVRASKGVKYSIFYDASMQLP